MNITHETIDFRMELGSFRQGYRAELRGNIYSIRPYSTVSGGGGADTSAYFNIETGEWSWGDRGELPFGRGAALKATFMTALTADTPVAASTTDVDTGENRRIEQAIKDGGGTHLRYLGADYDDL